MNETASDLSSVCRVVCSVSTLDTSIVSQIEKPSLYGMMPTRAPNAATLVAGEINRAFH